MKILLKIGEQKTVFPPQAMDFDHVYGPKVKQVSNMYSYSQAKILAEVAKCELVFTNCHRIRTQLRAGRPV